jgi:hypothetical protein
LPTAFALAQRAFAAAAILALAAALIVRLATFLAVGFAIDFTLAHRAFCPAAIASLPAALILRLFFGDLVAVEDEPRAADNSPFNFSILSTMSAARLNWWDASDSKFIGGRVYVRHGKAQSAKPVLPRTVSYRAKTDLID